MLKDQCPTISIRFVPSIVRTGITALLSSLGRIVGFPDKCTSFIGRCGACKAKLPAMAEPLEVRPEEFDEVVRDSKVPVLVAFWGPGVDLAERRRLT